MVGPLLSKSLERIIAVVVVVVVVRGALNSERERASVSNSLPPMLAFGKTNSEMLSSKSNI